MAGGSGGGEGRCGGDAGSVEGVAGRRRRAVNARSAVGGCVAVGRRYAGRNG